MLRNFYDMRLRVR